MLATLIQKCDKNHSISRTRDSLKFYRQSGATFYDSINTVYKFIKYFLYNKMSMFEGYGAFKKQRTHKRTRNLSSIVALHMTVMYSINSIARTRMARLPRMIRTHFGVSRKFFR